MEFVRGIDFQIRTVTEAPTAGLKDRESVEPALRDFLELQHFFKVQFVVEGHARIMKGGTETFWERLAINRAELIVSLLEAMGIERRLMRTKGITGRKTPNKLTVLIRMELISRN